MPPDPYAVDLFGASLRAFSFAFTSLSSSQQHSVGEIHVDLTSQLLFMKSTSSNASAGMDAVQSQTLFRGDENVMYTSLDLDNGGYSQCFKIDTSALLSKPVGGAVFQPFAGARMSGITTAGDPPVSAEEHFLSIDSLKIRLFIGPSGKLVSIHFHDVEDGREAKLLVRDFQASSSELSRSVFEAQPDWKFKCSTPAPSGSNGIHLREWDLLRVLFTGPSGSPHAGGSTTSTSGDDGMAVELPAGAQR